MPPSSSALRRADGGTPLTDEVLLAIWDRCPDLADLVRFAATCRRWRRLVSAEAAFICRTPRRLLVLGRFVRPLALGFFHRHEDAVPRFVPTASAARRFPGLLQQPPRSLSTMVDDGLFNIVASRNGLLVVDLRHRKHDRALINLCVCNPMTGAVHILPPLGGKDGRGYYACTVLTAEDDEKTVDPPRSSSYFRLIMIYTRGEVTAFRSYSSEDGRWSEEAKVTNARLGKKQMGLTHSGVVHPGGRLVYWLAKDVVFLLWLETLQSAVVSFPTPYGHEFPKFDIFNTLLAMSPEGMLCAVQFSHQSLRTTNPSFSIRITTCTKHLWWETDELIHPELPLPADVINIRLQWFCDKSGVVFFSVVSGDTDHRRYEMYALSLKAWMVEKLVCLDGGSNNPWGQVHRCEKNLLVAYLASLAEPEGIEDM